MKLEITKEKVLEAASKCSQAKEALKTLFPEVFDDYLEIHPFKVQIGYNLNTMIYIAQGLAPDGLHGKCFGLNEEYEWRLDSSKTGTPLLIPKKKQ